jgi:hypothetical protein
MPNSRLIVELSDIMKPVHSDTNIQCRLIALYYIVPSRGQIMVFSHTIITL